MIEMGDELQYLRVTPHSKMWSSQICYKKDLDLSLLYGLQDDWDPALQYDMNNMFRVTKSNELGLAVGEKHCLLFAFVTN